jgi:hypothetical protein
MNRQLALKRVLVRLLFTADCYGLAFLCFTCA